LIIFGGIFCIYDAILIILCPGTFLDNLFSFSHIWTFFGGILIFFGIYRIKKGNSFWKNRKKNTKIICGILVVFGILVSIINLIIILNPKKADISEPSDYLILLGGGIDKNGKLPENVMFRVEKTAEYLSLHPETKCVVTGGTLYWLPYPEAPEIKRQLVLRGIDDNQILVEDQAQDTIQNLQLSCEILSEVEECSVDRILKSRVMILTSDFHLARAERIANRLGYENAQGLGCKIMPIKVPHTYLREICAYVKLNLRILITGKPKSMID